MFQEIFIQFSSDISVYYDKLRFFCYGNELNECDTPEEWRLQDYDVIDGEKLSERTVSQDFHGPYLLSFKSSVTHDIALNIFKSLMRASELFVTR